MNNPHIATTRSTHLAQANFHPTIRTESEIDMKVEWLPFTVRLVRNEEDLFKAVQIRHSAYARHMPLVAETLKTPEKTDTEDGVAILLAESKIDGTPIGSVRIQSNRYRPLSLEKSVQLPNWLKDLSLAQVSRFGVAKGTIGRLVKMILVKGCLQYSKENYIDWDVIAARAPLDRTYRQLTYQDIFPEAGYIPLPHMDNVPHRIMGFEVATCAERLTAMKHPLLDFFTHTQHPDIDVTNRRTKTYLHADSKNSRQTNSLVS